jgi:hypothetical protein
MEIISTILGILNPISLIAKVITHLNRPQLEIYYDPKETYHKARDLSFNGILGNFGHVMVRNNGQCVAKNCAGELRGIEIYQNNGFQKATGYRNIMTLKWAHEKDFYPRDIDKDSPRRLDVCYVHQGFDILHFFTEKYPSGNQTDFPPGKYKIKIRIKSDNAKSTEKEFIINYEAGRFESLEIKNFP